MRYTLTLPLLFLSFWAYSQYKPLDIIVTTFEHAGIGGLNAPQFSSVDLNNNGTLDLLIYDREGRIALPLLNNGTTGQVDYHFAPEYMDRFPQGSENFMLLRDYDCDGIEDLFYFTRTQAEPSGGVAVLKGSYDSNNKIKFTTVDSTLFYINKNNSSTNKLFVYNSDLPAIDDIDGDGDMDILTFSTDFLFNRNVSWYKNMSAENGHNCDSLQFVLEHECWGLFSESGSNNTVLLSSKIDSCANNSAWPRSPRHIGSTLSTIDYNGDGVKDMLMGDATVNSLNMMTGSKVNDTILISTQDALYPSYDESVDLLTFPAAFFLDVNNDGKLDMLASPNDLAIGQVITDSVVWYYQNTQSNSNITLDLQQKDFLTGDMLDRGHDSYPSFFDYNADGLLDLVVGHYGFCQSDKNYRYGLLLLENTGSSNNPSFTLVSQDYANLSSLNMSGLHPTFGDLDGDNDQDMILGNSEGELIYIENTAGAGNTATWASPSLQYKSIDVGSNSAPQLVDLDRDGDLDLVVGEFNGNINYFENTGSSSSPTFNSGQTTAGLGNLDISSLATPSNRSAPHFVDINGQYELFVGHKEKGIIHLNNIENNILGTYSIVNLEEVGVYAGRYTDVAIADINGDTTLEMVVGNSRGGLMFFTQDLEPDPVKYLQGQSNQLIKGIFPNPTQELVHVQLQEANQTSIRFELYNIIGKKVWSQTTNTAKAIHQLPVHSIPNGVYILNIQSNNMNASSRLLIQR
ncbi:MAG: T9SS type A sorting domain-containing protein [Aureispira sp.]|nr:T9SS type A sorting domain-containing protein [Aureispira sp.]